MGVTFSAVTAASVSGATTTSDRAGLLVSAGVACLEVHGETVEPRAEEQSSDCRCLS